jgi:hypothetical protein
VAIFQKTFCDPEAIGTFNNRFNRRGIDRLPPEGRGKAGSRAIHCAGESRLSLYLFAYNIRTSSHDEDR